MDHAPSSRQNDRSTVYVFDVYQLHLAYAKTSYAK